LTRATSPLMLEKERGRQEKGRKAGGGFLVGLKGAHVHLCPPVSLDKQKSSLAGPGWGLPATCSFFLQAQVQASPSHATEVRVFSPLPPPSQARCLPLPSPTPQNTRGQEVMQAVNSWSDSGNDRGPKKKKQKKKNLFIQAEMLHVCKV
jgi:hypothetical protein